MKTPYYRVDAQRMLRLIEMVITGQAREHDWNLVMGMTIRHSPELEAIRQQCLALEEQYYYGESKPPFLFAAAAMDDLKKIRDELKLII